MSGEVATLRVTGNTPRLLKEGERPPAPVDETVTAEELEVPHVYWTPDKSQHIVARICHAASKFYGPSVKAAEWELELIGEPAAAVMNDWLPLRTGASSDKTANLIALGVVTAIIVALRLPDILEVHGIIKPWKPRSAAPETSSPDQQPAPNPTPAAPPTAFDEQLVGANGHAAAAHDDNKIRALVYGEQQIGGSGAMVAERD